MTLYGDIEAGRVRGTFSTSEGKVGRLWVVAQVAQVYCCIGSKSRRWAKSSIGRRDISTPVFTISVSISISSTY